MSKPVEQNNIVDEDEVSSYFTPQTWENMSKYDKSSYRNTLENYNVMKSMGLQPKKPWFMASGFDKPIANKRQSNTVISCPDEPKKPKQATATGETPMAETKQIKPRQDTPQIKRKHNKVAAERIHNQPSNRIMSETIVQEHTKFKLVIEIYKGYRRCHGLTFWRQRFILRKRTDKVKVQTDPKKLTISDAVLDQPEQDDKAARANQQNTQTNKLKEEIKYVCNGEFKSMPEEVKKPVIVHEHKIKLTHEEDSKANEEKFVENRKIQSIPNNDRIPNGETGIVRKLITEEGSIANKEAIIDAEDKLKTMPGRYTKGMTKTDNDNLMTEEGKNRVDDKPEDKNNLKKLMKRQKHHRTVQTQTAGVGEEVATSALVFVNASTSKRTEKHPDTDKKTIGIIVARERREALMKMLRGRSVLTQTAGENEPIEDAKLVFIQRLKTKPCPAPDNDINKAVPAQPSPQIVDDLQLEEGSEKKDKGKRLIKPVAKPALEPEPSLPYGDDEEDEFGFWEDYKRSVQEASTTSSACINWSEPSTSRAAIKREENLIKSINQPDMKKPEEFAVKKDGKCDVEKTCMTPEIGLSVGSVPGNKRDTAEPTSPLSHLEEEDEFEFGLMHNKSKDEQILSIEPTPSFPAEEEDEFEFGLMYDKPIEEKPVESVPKPTSEQPDLEEDEFEFGKIAEKEAEERLLEETSLKPSMVNAVKFDKNCDQRRLQEPFMSEQNSTTKSSKKITWRPPLLVKEDKQAHPPCLKLTEENNFQNTGLKSSLNQLTMNEKETVTFSNGEAESKKKSLEKPQEYEKDKTDSHQKGKRYPRRAVPKVNYTEGHVLDDDEYLFCDECDQEYEGDCPEHGPMSIIPDNYVPVTGDEKRAVETAPSLLRVADSKIAGGGLGVWTQVGLPAYARLGPYQGEKSATQDAKGYSWIITKNRKHLHYIAAGSKATSNWMRFVNCARHYTEQNLMAFQYKGEMYYRTVHQIPPKEELFVSYGKEYAEQLGISQEAFYGPDKSHIRNQVFPCAKCQRPFASPLNRDAHVKKCRGPREKAVKVDADHPALNVDRLAADVDGKTRYSCQLCQYSTGKKSHMSRHLTRHSGQRAYKCDDCGKTFNQASNLSTHKHTHSDVKRFKCTICAYTCHEAGSLKRHMMIHSGEVTFACDQCSYKTTTSSDITRHMRRHTGEKPFSCPHCPFRCILKSDLTRHIKQHTGEKPFSCPHCPYRCIEKSKLTRHIKTHR